MTLHWQELQNATIKLLQKFQNKYYEVKRNMYVSIYVYMCGMDIMFFFFLRLVFTGYVSKEININ